MRKVAGKKNLPTFQGVTTGHNMADLFGGKYGEIQNKYSKLDPFIHSDITRLRHYFLCFLAHCAKDLDGDFLFAGISFGVASKVVLEYVDFKSLDKVAHLIDPFEGVDHNHEIYSAYNRDIEYVKNQYKNDPSIIIHKKFIPNCFPIDNLEKLSFVHFNTSNADMETKSIPYIFNKLSPGGIFICDNYCQYGFLEDKIIYDNALSPLGVDMFTMPTGQGVFIKPRLK